MPSRPRWSAFRKPTCNRNGKGWAAYQGIALAMPTAFGK
jgi:hypothetical protein